MASEAEAADSDLPVGYRVGDYEVKDSVAEGGFGCVYRVEHIETGKHAALKVLHAELASTTEAVLRFEREVEVVRRLHHPNVVEIYASGRLSDGRPYFVMELLIGVDLDTHIRSRGRLPPTDMLAILEALCSALALAHEIPAHVITVQVRHDHHVDLIGSHAVGGEIAQQLAPRHVRRVGRTRPEARVDEDRPAGRADQVRAEIEADLVLVCELGRVRLPLLFRDGRKEVA